MSALPYHSKRNAPAATRERTRSRLRAVAEPLAVAIVSALLILALCWPMLFTDAIQGGDWLQGLWSVWSQSLSIQANHVPSYFISIPSGVLYPLYAFYGGTIFVLTGALALLPGSSPHTAYVFTFILGFAAAFGGWYWLARMSGIARWLAVLPGTIFITSSYYMTAVYARGDWPEFLAISSVPLMLAAGYSVFRAERLRIGPALALTTSSLLFTGSHNLTLLWGTSILTIFLLALIVLVPETRRQISLRRVLRLAALILPAALLNAWFLLPDIVYQSHTNIAEHFEEWRRALHFTVDSVSAKNLFALSRLPAGLPARTPDVFSLPVLAIAWVLLSFPLLAWRRWSELWVRLLALSSAAAVGVGVMMTHTDLILALPRPYTMLQFSHRLEGFVLMGLSGAILAGLVLGKALTGPRRMWQLALLPIAAFSVFSALQQVGTYGRSSTLEATKLASFTPQIGDYLNIHLRSFGEAKGMTKIKFPSGVLHGNRTSVTVHLSPGQLIDTNLYTYSNMVHVAGAKMLGIDDEGFAVLKVGPARLTRPAGARRALQTETISLSPASPLPIALGRIITLGAALALIARFALLVGRSRRHTVRPRRGSGGRRRAPQGPG